MSPDFGRAAFGRWVPEFVARNDAASGIDRPPTDGEVAAHRGLFQRAGPRLGNLPMFHAHACAGGRDGTDVLDPAKTAELERILAGGLEPAGTEEAVPRLCPFAAGNGRTARALGMHARSAPGLAPDRDGLPGDADAETPGRVQLPASA